MTLTWNIRWRVQLLWAVQASRRPGDAVRPGVVKIAHGIFLVVTTFILVTEAHDESPWQTR
jgi:hypothetical protein